MNAELIFQNEIKLTALHIICPFSSMQVEIAEGFSRLKSRLDEIKNRVDHTKIIGFYPQSSDAPDENICHYYLGVEVANHDVVPEQLISITIPSGQFVSYKYNGQKNVTNTLY
ncbi:GyrI-like domain-containing protein [Paenibacillus sedimenti]|uniref:Effector binding domain-containing protein n=1 Tax=Paenibacillus sedimenti TaxID=2770274 RepID=A0A926KPJ2_9BACL|nr:effector binding domain-containing protein [Paenibacillus sedimenti]MBD0380943.1 effector binding domain-containing protein [Paenibacillus sedimenti]